MLCVIYVTVECLSTLLCYVLITWLSSVWVLCYVMWCLRDWRVLEYFVMWYLRDWRVLEYFVMLSGVNVTVECLISVIKLQEGFIIVHVLLPSLSSWQYLKNRIKLIFKDQLVLQTRKLNDIIYTFIFNIISGRKAYSICVNWGIRPTLHHTIQNMNNKIYVIDCTVHTHDRLLYRTINSKLNWSSSIQNYKLKTEPIVFYTEL